MASEKKPSIYSDRSTIGSSSELDEYGVWVKSEPQDLSAGGAGDDIASSSPPDFDTDFSVMDTPIEAEDIDSGTDGLDLPDLDIPDDSMNISTTDDFSDFSDLSSTSSMDNLDELDNAEFEDISLPPPDGEPLADDTPMELETSSDASFEESFTEVPLNDFIGEEPSEITPLAAVSTDSFDAPSSSPAQSDLSTQLLMKIADELSSIRNELSSLKAEFAGIKSAVPADEKADAAHGGFFNEEEDEKISLTGDELDNILNTADFTEESGADAGDLEAVSDEASVEAVDSFDDLSLDDFSMPELDSAEPSPEDETQPSLEDAPLEPQEEVFEEAHFGHIEIEEHKDSEALKHLREHGSLTMTSAPEDTSYLDEETLSVDFETPLEEATTEEVTTETESAESSEVELQDSDLANSDSFEIGGEELSLSDEEFNLDDDLSLSTEPQPSPEDELGDVSELPSDDELGAVSLDDDIDMSAAEPVAEEPQVEETQVEDISLESAEEISLDEDTSALAELPAEDELADDFGSTEDFDDISLDLSDAVIDEPDLSGEITENPLSEPSPDSLSADDLSVDSLSAEDLPVEASLDDDLDTSTEDIVMGDALTDDAAAAAATDSLGSESFEIELDDSDMSFPDETAANAIIPEGFVESTDEAPVPFDDDLAIEDAGAIEDMDLPSLDTFDSAESESIELGEAEPVEALDGETAIEEVGISAADSSVSTDLEGDADIPAGIRGELKTVLAYMDQLLEALPEEKIEEFAKSEYYDTYKKLFKELGLV